MAEIMYCQNCGTKAKPKKITKGSIGMEIVLWIFFIVPGLIYSVWRLSTRQSACPSCKQPGMIPLSSPLLKETG